MNGLSFPPMYLPWAPFSMTPEEVQHLTSFVFGQGIKNVIEVGGGVSTACLTWSMCYMNEDTVLRTLEEDSRWIAKVDTLALHAQECYSKIHGECSHHTNYFTHSWADTIEYIKVGEERPGLVIIDGPCATEDPEARRVNVPPILHLRDQYGPLYVWVDDTNRPGEQKVLKDLKDGTPYSVDTVYQNERYALLLLT